MPEHQLLNLYMFMFYNLMHRPDQMLILAWICRPNDTKQHILYYKNATACNKYCLCMQAIFILNSLSACTTYNIHTDMHTILSLWSLISLIISNKLGIAHEMKSFSTSIQCLLPQAEHR